MFHQVYHTHISSLTFFLSHQGRIKCYFYSTMIPATGCIRSFPAIITKDIYTYILAIKEKTLPERIILFWDVKL